MKAKAKKTTGGAKAAQNADGLSAADRKRKAALEAEYAAFSAQLEAWHDELSRRPTRTMLVSVPAAVYGWIASEAEFLDVNPGEFAARIVKVAYDVAKGVK